MPDPNQVLVRKIFFIWRAIFTKFGIDYCLRQWCNLRRNFSDGLTIAYSCHANWSTRYLYGRENYTKHRYNLRRNCSVRIIIAFSCHTNWSTKIRCLYGKLFYWTRYLHEICRALFSIATVQQQKKLFRSSCGATEVDIFSCFFIDCAALLTKSNEL